MIVFRYDKTFEGLLTAVFDAYSRRTFPDILLTDGGQNGGGARKTAGRTASSARKTARRTADSEMAPLFVTEEHIVVTDPEKSGRVWRGLEARLPKEVCNMLFFSWLSEEPGVEMMLARYMRRVFDLPRAASRNVATDFSDPDILTVKKLAQKVSRERERLMQFTRFQKGGGERGAENADSDAVGAYLCAAEKADSDAVGGCPGAAENTAGGDSGNDGNGRESSGNAADGGPTYFAPVSPIYNALPLAIPYFRDRFRDQKWLIYDIRRRYGFYYDLETVTEITMDDDAHLLAGELDEALLAKDEKLFQTLWKSYFDSMAIAERINPRLQRQHMPKRFWPLLTEMK